MVGLVIVSHSARLAEGVAELVQGMGGPEVPLRATGGVDVPGRPLGTDALSVLRAIEEVYSEDGVLVLMDLGSAVLSAEMALDMLPPGRRARVVLCEGPVVEGAVSAAVQARLGATLERTAAEARGALGAKKAQLAGDEPPPTGGAALPGGPAAAPAEPEHALRLTLRNRLGIHARPAARLVQAAGRLEGTEVLVENLTARRGPVSARSINAVITLGARQGHELLVTASGPGARQALQAVQDLLDDDFGDRDAPAAPPVPAATAPVPGAAPTPGAPGRTAFSQGTPVSPGIAIGAVRLLRPPPLDVPMAEAADPQAEWAQLRAALQETRQELTALRDAVARRADPASAALFDAHLLFLDDEALVAPSRAAILEQRLGAAAAWKRSFERVAADYRALDDDYLRGRAADVLDVGRQVLASLLGAPAPAASAPEPGVLVAAELRPADAARLDPERVRGIVTALGGPTSHGAILARALGIPAVAGVGEGILALEEGTLVVLDGESGRVFAHPSQAVLAEYQRRAEVERVRGAAARAAAAGAAVTRDGHRVEVGANVGTAADARAAVASGAEGVGLFRTELLFLDRKAAPDEDGQVAAYRAVAEAMGGRPLVVRTLDAGGDKPLPYLDLGHEANPFLGWRAIRVCLALPELFQVQLRAIVRVAAEFPLRVLFPMVATLAEWRAARGLLEEARLEVQRRGQPVPARIEAGILVEIPAAALCAPLFAAEVDFFSIGTNDLTQYTMAAERGNPRLLALSDACHPAVLKLVQMVVASAHARGRRVGVCGELAGDPEGIPLLVGLGVDELSVSAPSIPRAKEVVRGLDLEAARALAERALSLDSPGAVRAQAGGLSGQRLPRPSSKRP